MSKPRLLPNWSQPAVYLAATCGLLSLSTTGRAGWIWEKKDKPAVSQPATSKPAPSKPEAAKTAASAPAASPALAIPVASPGAGDFAPVPETGSLNLDDLINLALQNSPKISRLRAQIGVHLAEARASYDWRDPEFRFGWSKGLNTDIADPYTETRSSSTFTDGSQTSRSNGDSFRGVNPLDARSTERYGNVSESVHQRDSQRTDQYTVRRIIPGRYEDVIEERTYQVEHSRQRTGKNGTDSLGRKTASSGEEITTRREVSSTREVRKHPDDGLPDEAFGFGLRFYIPNPFEVRAKAARYRSEASLAGQELRAEVRKITLGVKEAYQMLQFWNSTLAYNREIGDLHEAALKTLTALQGGEGQTTPGMSQADIDAARLAGAKVNSLDLPVQIIEAREDLIKSREEVLDTERRMDAVRYELAYDLGLGNPSRIHLSNKMPLRRVDLGSIDTASLLELALSSRSELLQLQSRIGVARGQLDELKSSSIPWPGFLQGSYNKSYNSGLTAGDEFGISLSTSLPLFSLSGINQKHKVYEQEIRGYEDETRATRSLIQRQVEGAVNELKIQSARLEEWRKFHAQARSFDERSRAEIVGNPKAPEVELKSRESVLKSERGGVQSYQAYNAAVLHLEAALGMDLEDAFGSLNKPAPAPEQPSAKPAAAPQKKKAKK